MICVQRWLDKHSNEDISDQIFVYIHEYDEVQTRPLKTDSIPRWIGCVSVIGFPDFPPHAFS